MNSLTSLTNDQFDELHDYCDAIAQNRGLRYIDRRDLLMFLCKMRQGLSDDFLTLLFGYSSRQATSLAVGKVAISLDDRFVVENVGVGSITREQYIDQHVTEFANILYNPEPHRRVAIVHVDGTYTYCHKTENFRALRQTYSTHKNRHLIKPTLIVAANGHILHVLDSYFADAPNNDAAVLHDQWQNNQELREWFREGDIFVVDRGYRDIIPILEAQGMVCKMPPFIETNERQFTTENANAARIITKTRWIVEARNGYVKTMFELLNNVQQIHVLPHIGRYYRIATAIINRYHPKIYMEGANAEMAERLLQKALAVNHVQQRVIDENLEGRNAQRWIRMDETELEDFPILTIDYLKEITEGVYQIGLAPSYVQDKFEREGNNGFFIEMLADENRLPEPGFMRVRVGFRFVGRRLHYLWIEYVPNGNVAERPITGYYCLCRSGARTVGMCAHITSVLWYLGFARHEENVHYPSYRLLEEIEDAGHREEQEDPP